MKKTMIQKIFENHSKKQANVGDIIDISIDARIARDFGGANVVKQIKDHKLLIDNAAKTFFTFDCNPGGCDQKYAENQQKCRMFAREHDIKIFDINQGIGTHLAFEQNLIAPGDTFVSTDSHANILGALGVFGQGMGDRDIAYTFAHGKIWFKVPPTVKIILKGIPSQYASAKDVVLKMAKNLGANGLLGYAAEIYGEYIDNLSLDGRITIASMATEMGGIIMLFTPNQEILDYYQKNFNTNVSVLSADEDAVYEKIIEIDISDLVPMISRPGHPEDVVRVDEVKETIVDSGFIGSCTNGRLEDMKAVAQILKDKTIAPGRILKIVPATDSIWKSCLQLGYIDIFKKAGALIGSAGCAGCAAGQIGQTGEGEIAVSSGNRNFVGKQGKGQLFLASPETVAASLVSGYITTKNNISLQPVKVKKPLSFELKKEKLHKSVHAPFVVKGKAWVIKKDNIDTDMIFHNRYLSITDIDEMGQYTFDNLKGYEQFAKKVKKGDIVVVGKNFGCGSSRQQAVDCFKSLGVSLIIAESFGSIYERNAINNAMPILVSSDICKKIDTDDRLIVDLKKGEIVDETKKSSFSAKAMSDVQLNIYKRGGLLSG